MNKTVLFSPVGKTDPYRDCYEGPLLHIIRHYNPDLVYLFLTPEMAEDAVEDDRFCRAILRQAQLLGRDPNRPQIVILASDTTDPSNFDAFSKEYKTRFEKIIQDNPVADILINVSSGTPQMIATACLLASSRFGNKTYHCIQVKNPSARSGARNPYMQGYQDDDIDQLLDNLPDSDNRCVEPNILLFNETLRREQVRKLIERYDYSGALRSVQEEPSFFNDALVRWLKHLIARVSFDCSKADKILLGEDKASFNPYPVQNNRVRPIFEFYLGLQVKHNRGEWSDYLLKLSPILTELAKYYLTECLMFPLDRLIEIRSNKQVISRSKIAEYDNKLIAIFESQFGKEFKDPYISLSILLIILKYASNSIESANVQQIIKNFNDLRKYEEDLRNPVAHQFVQVSDNWATSTAGLSFGQIHKQLIKLIGMVMLNKFGADWSTFFERINQHLLALIDCQR